jgi:outer membrane protein assembly factor BamB
MVRALFKLVLIPLILYCSACNQEGGKGTEGAQTAAEIDPEAAERSGQTATTAVRNVDDLGFSQGADSAQRGVFPGQAVRRRPTLLWKERPGGSVPGHPVFINDVMITAFADSGLAALSLAGTVNSEWNYRTDVPIVSSPIYHDGSVYMTASNGFLHCVSVSSGREVWKTALDQGVGVFAPVPTEKAVYVLSRDGILYSVRREDGSILRRDLVSGDVVTPPALLGNKLAFCTGSGGIHVVDTETGSSLHTILLDEAAFSPPVLSQRALFIGDSGGRLYSFSMEDGSTRWRFSSGDVCMKRPALWNGKLYYYLSSGSLLCLDAETGKELWTFRSPGAAAAEPVIVEGVVYLSSDDKAIFAVDGESGLLLWNYRLPSRLSIPPLVYHGAVYVSAEDGWIYALSEEP